MTSLDASEERLLNEIFDVMMVDLVAKEPEDDFEMSLDQFISGHPTAVGPGSQQLGI